MRIFEQGKCEGYYTYDVTKAMFCAGWPEGGRDSCQVSPGAYQCRLLSGALPGRDDSGTEWDGTLGLSLIHI